MIPLTDVGSHQQSWQWHLANAVTDINELVRYLELDGDWPPAPDFPLLVPRPWLDRIRKGDPCDPLLLQILPRSAEQITTDGYSADPLQEQARTPCRGLIHKYPGRVLTVVSGACAINCRYCFRRHFPYQDFQPDTAGWQQVFDYVARDPGIAEMILSGGDPLVLNDKRLAWIVANLEEIPHLTTLRIHTRLPVVIPARVCDDLLGWLQAGRLHKVVVVHANHPNEIDDEVADATARLRDAGVQLLNQSVLLRGVNDDPDTLVALSRRLFEAGVLPYYLHLPDKVAGTAHFDLSEAEALDIHRRITGQLPGYLVPRLAKEVPGEASKVTLAF